MPSGKRAPVPEKKSVMTYLTEDELLELDLLAASLGRVSRAAALRYLINEHGDVS